MRFLRLARYIRPRRESQRSGQVARAANREICAAIVVVFGALRPGRGAPTCYSRAKLCWQGLRCLLKFSRCSWASSSAGRAPRSQRGGRGFESPLVHQTTFLLSIAYRTFTLSLEQRGVAQVAQLSPEFGIPCPGVQPNPTGTADRS